MADFVSSTCPSCNGKLQIGKDLDRFACGYCGTEFVVVVARLSVAQAEVTPQVFVPVLKAA